MRGYIIIVAFFVGWLIRVSLPFFQKIERVYHHRRIFCRLVDTSFTTIFQKKIERVYHHRRIFCRLVDTSFTTIFPKKNERVYHHRRIFCRLVDTSFTTIFPKKLRGYIIIVAFFVGWLIRVSLPFFQKIERVYHHRRIFCRLVDTSFTTIFPKKLRGYIIIVAFFVGWLIRVSLPFFQKK